MENYKLINEKECPINDSNLDSITLASQYYLGEGVEKDETKAFYMFRELAEKEEPMAQHNMGCFYEEGLCNQPQNYRSEDYSRLITNEFGMGLFLLASSSLMRLCYDYKEAKIVIPQDAQTSLL